jgi:alpha-tubulin suppressor-like RCC1 family protein
MIRSVLFLALVTALAGCLGVPAAPGERGSDGGGSGGGDGGGGGGPDADVSCGGAIAFAQITAGGDHTCGRDTDGKVWCWGLNDAGQLGDGTFTPRGTPVAVAAAFTAVDVSAGVDHTCAVTDGDGQVLCWGGNGADQLGRGSDDDDSAIPSPVLQAGDGQGTLTSVKQVAAGDEATCALTTYGEVWCWGKDDDDQAGGSGSDSIEYAVQISGLPTAEGIAVGGANACAWTGDGALYCWGDNGDGQLAQDSGDSSGKPTAIDVPQVRQAAVSDQICILTRNGSVLCWGDNGDGQLGVDGDDSSTPLTIQGLAPSVAVATGDGISCAADDDHSVWCWGRELEGDLGRGQGGISLAPRQVELAAAPTQISATGHHVCAQLEGGGVACWGSDGSGQLGRTPELVAAPHEVSVGFPVGLVAAGEHTCVTRASDGRVACFGPNSNSELGTGDDASSSSPRPLDNLMNTTGLAAADNHTCAIASLDGAPTLACWGHNNEDQSNPKGGETTTPTPVTELDGQTVAAVAAGTEHTCVVAESGARTVSCFGAPADGFEPVSDSTVSTPSLVAAAEDHGCASDGASVYCWGSNEDGRLGDGSGEDATPEAVATAKLPDQLTTVIDLAAAHDRTCAVVDGGAVYCWGHSSRGGLGTGDSGADTPALVADLPEASTIDLSHDTSCAITADRNVWCWGDNRSGQVGGTDVDEIETPRKIEGVSDAVELGVGNEHVCVVTGSGALTCWGADLDGRLASGRTLAQLTPVAPLGVCE